MSEYAHEKSELHLTGTLTPLSSHMFVIPRFWVMRSVRIEFGIHFGVANFATVELKCLTLVYGGKLHSRNIGGDGVKGLRERSDPAETHSAAHFNDHPRLFSQRYVTSGGTIHPQVMKLV